MRILLTGVAGFLGSNLLSELLRRGHEVVGIDNLSMGVERNIAAHASNPRFRFVRGDVTDPSTFRDAPGPCDRLVHLAAFKIPRYGKRLETLQVNYRGTENALEHAVRQRCKAVLVSTSDVYGHNPKVPFAEADDSVLGPSSVGRWSYAVSKLFDEHLAFAYQEAHGIPVAVVRIFGSYGPHQALSWWGGPQSVFIDAALRGEPIPLHGDGLQTRSFTYVSDTVAGICAATLLAEADGEIINVGGDHEITIRELGERVWSIVRPGETPRFLPVPYESFTGKAYQDVRRRVPDVRKCRELLGVAARVGLDEGLRMTVDWQRRVRELAG